MPSPTVHDDGSTVTLDLHGATVDEALDLTFRLVDLASARGRGTAKIIHGSSTSRSYGRRTIKRTLHDLLDQGALAAVVSAWRADNYVLLSLPAAATNDPSPIRMLDLVR